MNRFRATALAVLAGGFTIGMCACAALKDLPDTAVDLTLAASLADAKGQTEMGRMNTPLAYSVEIDFFNISANQKAGCDGRLHS